MHTRVVCILASTSSYIIIIFYWLFFGCRSCCASLIHRQIWHTLSRSVASMSELLLLSIWFIISSFIYSKSWIPQPPTSFNKDKAELACHASLLTDAGALRWAVEAVGVIIKGLGSPAHPDKALRSLLPPPLLLRRLLYLQRRLPPYWIGIFATFSVVARQKFTGNA